MAENKDVYRLTCLHLIEKKIGWGDSVHWSNADFDKLSDLIYQQTGVLLSASTLKRVWGRVHYQGKPAISTLDALANFAGYENWRAFVVQQEEKEEQTATSAPFIERKKSLKFSQKLILPTFLIFFIGLFIIFSFLNKTEEKTNFGSVPLSNEDFSFSSKAITQAIPNSVIFTYNATRSPTDSVFIQQSWDESRRVRVSKAGTTHTSIYYEPGYYMAKLVIGKQVVKEHPLLIPTDGWLATISRSPIPIYLKKEAVVHKDQLSVPSKVIEDVKVSLLPNPPIVKVFNVGNFDTPSIHDFSFESQVKNSFEEGSGACQFSQVILLTDAMPIVIPLSMRGCVSDLSLMAVDSVISGKNTDLSKFGVNLSEWVKVGCKSNGEVLQFYVNNEEAYEMPLASKETKIVGIAYVFMGIGSVKGVKLANSKKILYHAF